MSTFPETAFTPLAGGFAAARLNVVEDDRVRAAEEQARALGYSAGYAAGARAAAAETESLRARLVADAQDQQRQVAETTARMHQAFSAAVQGADARVLPLLDDSRALLYSLALDLASAALGVDVHADSAHVPGLSVGAHAALVRALELPHDVLVTSIRMNPSDAALVQENWTAVAQVLGSRIEDVEIIPDASLSVGDAVSEFEDGFLDARLVTAMDRAREALKTELEAMEISRQGAQISAASVSTPV